jgi:hypothetical protein
MRTPDLLPDIALVPNRGRTTDLVHCEEDNTVVDAENNACEHGHILCPDCWPAWCRDCANDASDQADADLADDLWHEAREARA